MKRANTAIRFARVPLCRRLSPNRDPAPRACNLSTYARCLRWVRVLVSLVVFVCTETALSRSMTGLVGCGVRGGHQIKNPK